MIDPETGWDDLVWRPAPFGPDKPGEPEPLDIVNAPPLTISGILRNAAKPQPFQGTSLGLLMNDEQMADAGITPAGQAGLAPTGQGPVQQAQPAGGSQPGGQSSAPAGDAPNAKPADDPVGALLGGVSQGEGTDDAAVKRSKGKFNSGYDVTYKNNAYGTPAKPISQMSLDEVRQYQRQMADQQNAQGISLPSTPVGKYQITGTTLDGLERNMQLKGSEVFSPDLQDRMAKELLNESGLRSYQAGKINAQQFQNGLAKQWDSIADPATGATKHGGRLGMTSQQAQDYISRIPVHPH